MEYLIAGLGNPELKHACTRHNIGFMVLDKLATKHGISFKTEPKAKRASLMLKQDTLHLIQPTTYMNNSGEAVCYWLQQLKLPVENLLVVVDDLVLPFGAIKLKPKGGSAGHNGLKSIERYLATQEYARIRFGIGRNFSKGVQVDYVLSQFDEQTECDEQTERDQLPALIDLAIEFIHSFASIGPDLTMTKLNKKQIVSKEE